MNTICNFYVAISGASTLINHIYILHWPKSSYDRDDGYVMSELRSIFVGWIESTSGAYKSCCCNPTASHRYYLSNEFMCYMYTQCHGIWGWINAYRKYSLSSDNDIVFWFNLEMTHIHRNGRVVTVTPLFITGGIKAKLEYPQWRPEQSSWPPFCFCI